MTQSDVIQLLTKKLGKRHQTDLAAEIGCSPQYLHDVLKGTRKPGPKILKYLGLTHGYQIA